MNDRLGVLHELEDWLEKPMIALSAVWLALLVIELAWGAPRPLEILSLVIWAVFIGEFLLRFVLAPHKLGFLGRNVITLAALAVPAFRLLRIARVLRVMRVARVARGATLVRVVGGVNRSMNALRRSLKRRGFGYVLSLTLVVCLLGAVGMRAFEADGPNGEAFDTFGDSLWWTAMILTTMGSQAWPATGEGRLLALFLSIYAFAVFGYVAGALASLFIGQDRQDEESKREEIEALREEVDALRRDLREVGPKP